VKPALAKGVTQGQAPQAIESYRTHTRHLAIMPAPGVQLTRIKWDWPGPG
jgi:hypothetical protein